MPRRLTWITPTILVIVIFFLGIALNKSERENRKLEEENQVLTKNTEEQKRAFEIRILEAEAREAKAKGLTEAYRSFMIEVLGNHKGKVTKKGYINKPRNWVK
ncbi:MAG: hypothetical protein A2908_04130 [Candidatus Staskawiczbacteria bacterium RIFCSPLOWO2_01_FULL_38_12b]|uniref:Uncharacterized protein n=1 Tax=Candidatus Staskawiczbacteria bacterium RIFCSPLOWO2_01_FULL_38_12b TaxID=1802214 RepID=A0A1G2IFD1_9BACT|nr:MAG: hypothetical protein A2908_04130 [Candidatus Staskawiczbacteria bacterium RIFCSPLOWO2_01_FULL_38_12b]